ncbi:MAG: hypothetical protein JSW11_00125 [Candidatus Heimdallarchaeota archaeon]|nr:MAG: hypothetical protein JSW11_00125 [Candidatus Heimdallarchaeota archaeon]
MQVTEQFGIKKSLDQIFQLLFMSTNLFSSIELQNKLCSLQMKEGNKFTDSELRKLLTYFLDLIEYFSHEKLQIIQDPTDSSRYTLTGGF